MNTTIRPLALALVTAGCLTLTACGGGGGGGSSSAATPASNNAGNTLSGSAGKGVLKGATVTAYAIARDGQLRELGKTTTRSDNEGGFSLDLGSHTGPIVIKVHGGKMQHEARVLADADASNDDVDFDGELLGVVPMLASGKNIASVNLGTHLAADAVLRTLQDKEHGAGIAADPAKLDALIQAAEQVARDTLGLSLNPSQIKPASLAELGGATADTKALMQLQTRAMLACEAEASARSSAKACLDTLRDGGQIQFDARAIAAAAAAVDLAAAVRPREVYGQLVQKLQAVTVDLSKAPSSIRGNAALAAPLNALPTVGADGKIDPAAFKPVIVEHGLQAGIRNAQAMLADVRTNLTALAGNDNQAAANQFARDAGEELKVAGGAFQDANTLLEAAATAQLLIDKAGRGEANAAWYYAFDLPGEASQYLYQPLLSFGNYWRRVTISQAADHFMENTKACRSMDAVTSSAPVAMTKVTCLLGQEYAGWSSIVDASGNAIGSRVDTIAHSVVFEKQTDGSLKWFSEANRIQHNYLWNAAGSHDKKVTLLSSGTGTLSAGSSGKAQGTLAAGRVQGGSNVIDLTFNGTSMRGSLLAKNQAGQLVSTIAIKDGTGYQVNKQGFPTDATAEVEIRGVNSTFNGKLQAGGFVMDKSKTTLIASKLAFNGNISQGGAEKFSGNVQAEVSGWEQVDNSTDVTTGNYPLGTSVTLAGKLTLPVNKQARQLDARVKLSTEAADKYDFALDYGYNGYRLAGTGTIYDPRRSDKTSEVVFTQGNITLRLSKAPGQSGLSGKVWAGSNEIGTVLKNRVDFKDGTSITLM